MADEENKFRTLSIYWSNEDTGDSKGITSSGNRRPKKRHAGKGGNKKESYKKNLEIPTKATAKAVDVTDIGKTSKEDSVQVKKDKEKENRNGSLKDLCLEDKKRVANLIKELARLGEEKETMTELLTNERHVFEDQIKDVLAQQEKIMTEREEIQSQLIDCQDLIVKYQQLLKEYKTDSSAPSAANSATASAASVPTNSTKTSTTTAYSAYDNRPFTMVIDKLINEEKLESESNADRELKLGPLVNPKFESTQSSDADFKSSDFKPLYSETTNGSLSQYTITETEDENKNFEQVHLTSDLSNDQYNKSPSINQVVNGANFVPIPEDLNDGEFLKCYRELNPEQRKLQLYLQKQSLLQEQDRLKSILTEQETLLNMKQLQLKQQQELQSKRLSYFEKTGSFPDSGHMSHPMDDMNNAILHNSPFGMANNLRSSFGGTSHSYPYPQSHHLNLVTGSATYHQPEMEPTVQKYPDYPNFTRKSPSVMNSNKQIYREADTQTSFHHPVLSETHPSQQYSRQQKIQHTRTVPTYQKKRNGVGGGNVDKLLSIVDEADSLFEDSSLENPLKQYLQPTRKLSTDDEYPPVDLFQNLDRIYEKKTAENLALETEDGNAYYETYASDLSHNSILSEQDELDESNVLEDVFFIK